MFWYWFFVGPALILAFLSLRGERKRAAYVRMRLKESVPALPPATVIVPVKGTDEGLRANLAALAALDYPDYELIVAARSASDIPPGVLPGRVKVVLANGSDPDTGEKVQNLQAAVRAARKQSDIFVFADSDGRPAAGWLRSLAAPLAEKGVGASTGYRWFVPAPAAFWPLLRGVWDAVTAGTMGPGNNRFAWGGAMAIRKETFFAIRVPEYWKGTVSDDFALTEAVHAAGLTIAWAPGALTPCPSGTGAAEFLRWTRRQMTLTRVYRPKLWWTATIAHVFYCGGMVASIAGCCRGSRLAACTLIAQVAPGMWKGFRRAVLARTALPECEDWFRRHLWVHAGWVPLATWMWLAALLYSAFGNTIEWRGYRYKLSRRATI